MQEVQSILPTGSVVGDRYVVEDLLGKGGFGAVYLVKDTRVRQNLFALKEVVDPNKRERDRFAFECEVLRRLDHPALPHVYRVFKDDIHDRAYMLMDYVEGPNLETLRQQQPDKRLPLPQVLTIMAPIMNAVSYLHSQHPPIIHRDIKPANIIVPTSGDETVLVDFGIAKVYDPDSTTTAVRHCSPGYGAPEQYGIGTNTRTDVYGLGATIYAALTPQPSSTSPGTSPGPVSGIPALSAAYSGAIHNNAGVDASMTLTSVVQNGSNFTGYFTVGPQLLGSGPFNGTIDAKGHLQLTVQGYRGNSPLLFTGSVQSNGDLVGDYCSMDKTGHCSPSAGGFGTWHVSPDLSGSGLSSGSSFVHPGGSASFEEWRFL